MGALQIFNDADDDADDMSLPAVRVVACTECSDQRAPAPLVVSRFLLHSW